MKLYHSLPEIEQDPSLLGYVRMLRRAWKTFELDLVLCVNSVPTLFRTTRTQALRNEELHELHRQFWNQGLASILMVIDSQRAFLLSGLEPPQTVDDLEKPGASMNALIEALTNLPEAEQNAIFRSVENGEFYRRYSDKFKSKGLVDDELTRNLGALSQMLQSGARTFPVPEETAHNFICRLLFTCYLVDRRVYRLPESRALRDARLHEALASQPTEKASSYLYNIFRQLKRKFNGSMFDQDLSGEEALISPHIERIIDFLQGGDIISGQRSLGFWAYDFRMIPIETISGVYENFLTEEDRKGKGAHYTPRLLAEMTLDVACEQSPNWDRLRYFDPCCGSGVFLVTLFNRLATSWELKNPRKGNGSAYYQAKVKALEAILKTQIRGMDIKASACTLASFSLYVAFLDSFEPTDIEVFEQHGNKLPRILKKNGAKPDIPVIHHGDSITAKRFNAEPFDRLIGNPPWGGTGGRGSGDPSFQFVEKADEWLKPGGEACLLLPSKNFLNITNEAKQARWLQGHRLERVVQLADFRRFLFTSGIAPCMIVRFTTAPAEDDHSVTYDTPKYDLSARRKGFVRITSSDRKFISQARLRQAAEEGKDAHVLWKQFFWGTPRDWRLLRYLDGFGKVENHASIGESDKRWVKGEGFILGNKSQKAWWSPNDAYIGARSKSLEGGHFLLPMDCEVTGTKRQVVERPRQNNKRIFKPPHVLISQGFGKVVFCDFPVLFQDSLQAIHGPEEDEPLLLFLTAYLQSSLAKYYCFHTSSKLGIERDVVRFEELLRLPFPLPPDAPAENAQAIVDEIAACLRKEKAELETLAPRFADNPSSAEWLQLRTDRAENLRQHFAPLIYQYFGLLEPEQALVEDAVHIFLPSTTPPTPDRIDLPTLTPLSKAASIPGYRNGLRTYADTLTKTLNDWAKERRSAWRVNANGWIDNDSGLAMTRLEIVPKAQKRPFSPELDGSSLWPKVYDALAAKQAAVHFEREIIGFVGVEFFVLRPLSLTHWTRTRALNDADDFFAQYLRHGQGGGQ